MPMFEELIKKADALARRFDALGKYTVERVEGWGLGGGVNGYGKREKKITYFVMNPQGRRCRGFDVNANADESKAKKQAEDWARYLSENM